MSTCKHFAMIFAAACGAAALTGHNPEPLLAQTLASRRVTPAVTSVKVAKTHQRSRSGRRPR